MGWGAVPPNRRNKYEVHSKVIGSCSYAADFGY